MNLKLIGPKDVWVVITGINLYLKVTESNVGLGMVVNYVRLQIVLKKMIRDLYKF